MTSPKKHDSADPKTNGVADDILVTNDDREPEGGWRQRDEQGRLVSAPNRDERNR